MAKVSLEDHSGPWTEEEFLALDESSYRVELLEGGLWVSPGPNSPHQQMIGRLTAAFLPAADEAAIWVMSDMNTRLEPGTVMRPDLVLARGPRVATVVDASDVLLAVEITSPSNVTSDRVLKMQLYAQAKIKWYLLVEPDMTTYESVTLRLFRLGAGGYDTYAVAEGDENLTLDEPFPLTINAQGLLGIHKRV
ncbi:Uma2 family endonuclease [Actinoplanes sp. NPDC051861]|uniref:Uma2 family endonuclease n=1 Tax=Actinoplanes sp. NPDC051861 TaxID=3155170 RepID=UPI003430F49B